VADGAVPARHPSRLLPHRHDGRLLPGGAVGCVDHQHRVARDAGESAHGQHPLPRELHVCAAPTTSFP
jgi:hypothetical protein